MHVLCCPPQVISRFKLPPQLSVDGSEYGQLQAELAALAEPGASTAHLDSSDCCLLAPCMPACMCSSLCILRSTPTPGCLCAANAVLHTPRPPTNHAGARVTWRYAVLSNMLLMFAAPPATSAAAARLLRHCLGLLRSDMLLLRQVGGAGLWLLLAQVTDHGVDNPAMLQELKQVGAGIGCMDGRCSSCCLLGACLLDASACPALPSRAACLLALCACRRCQPLALASCW